MVLSKPSQVPTEFRIPTLHHGTKPCSKTALHRATVQRCNLKQVAAFHYLLYPGHPLFTRSFAEAEKKWQLVESINFTPLFFSGCNGSSTASVRAIPFVKLGQNFSGHAGPDPLEGVSEICQGDGTNTFRCCRHLRPPHHGEFCS